MYPDKDSKLLKPRNQLPNSLKSHSIKQYNNNKPYNHFNKTNIGSALGDDDLCEMIEKVQGTRYENQRCELTQDFSVSWNK